MGPCLATFLLLALSLACQGAEATSRAHLLPHRLAAEGRPPAYLPVVLWHGEQPPPPLLPPPPLPLPLLGVAARQYPLLIPCYALPHSPPLLCPPSRHGRLVLQPALDGRPSGGRRGCAARRLCAQHCHGGQRGQRCPQRLLWGRE